MRGGYVGTAPDAAVAVVALSLSGLRAASRRFDNIEVAQFVYLLLHNEKIRDVIDTIGKKAVLILGRFTAERKAVLDALREELRKRDYLPILFDFDVPATRDITETVSLLARMARFVVADITDARSIPQELSVIVPDLPSCGKVCTVGQGSDDSKRRSPSSLKFKNPEAPAVKREAEEDWRGGKWR